VNRLLQSGISDALFLAASFSQQAQRRIGWDQLVIDSVGQNRGNRRSSEPDGVERISFASLVDDQRFQMPSSDVAEAD
jgi:hypothetical protein